MKFWNAPLALIMLSVGLLTSCSTVETIPKVRVLPNSSGLQAGEFRAHGPLDIFNSFQENGLPSPPQIPSGVSTYIERIRPLHNKEPRYFIRASGSLEIVSLERINDYGLYSGLPEWRRLLASDGFDKPATQKILYQRQRELGEIPWMNAGRCFHGKLRRHTFPWGKAMMFLTSYVQGGTGGPVNNDMLVLVVQGFTNDGRYAVKGHFEIHHPKLPNSAHDKSFAGKVYFPIDDEGDRAEKWLDAQADSAFTPSFSQYEALLAALEILPGTTKFSPAMIHQESMPNHAGKGAPP